MSDSIPEGVREVCAEEARSHPTDVDAAVDAAVERIKSLPGYRTFVADLVRSCVRDLIHDVRHRDNRSLRNTAYRERAGGSPGRHNESTIAAHVSVYEYRIAGTILGEIRGEEIGILASGERESSATHRKNAELLEWCARQGVTGEKRIRDVVPEGRLRTQFELVFGPQGSGRSAG